MVAEGAVMKDQEVGRSVADDPHQRCKQMQGSVLARRDHCQQFGRHRARLDVRLDVFGQEQR